jgi:hypothetical protein
MRPLYQDICKRLDLKGTILLTPEGINMFRSGPRAKIDEFLAWVRSDVRFADLEVKESLDELQSIGTWSGYTCPECHGALWKLSEAVPPRFRCHTGHSFTARVLSELQNGSVEATLWSSLRALQEKARMEQEMLDNSLSRQVDTDIKSNFCRVRQQLFL